MTRRSTSGREPDAQDHLHQMLSTLDRSDSGRSMSFFDWALRVPEPKAGRLDFDRFPFQRELYHEGAEEREIVIKKATQVGVSAMAIRWAIYWADTRGLSALYVFPHQHQLRDFSNARIRPLIDASEYLQTRVANVSVQNTTLKQIGAGLIYLRGSESAADLKSVDADVLVLDEYDTLVAANVPDAERRLGASHQGLIRRVGVPTLPGMGISELYAKSDRRQWHVRCEACGDRQPLTFQDNVDSKRLTLVCRDCRRRVDVAVGEWVAEFPDRDIRGYHLPRLIVPNADLGLLVRAWQETHPARHQAFVNQDLGLEYAPDDARLTLAFIEAAQRPYACPTFYAGDGLVTMGVDVASVRNLNVRISVHDDADKKHALFIGEADDFNALDELMDRYGVHMAAIDALPERRLSAAFAERFAGRVYLVSYTSALNADPFVVHEEDRRVTVARVDMIDETLELIRGQRNLLPRELPADFVSHVQAVIRSVESDVHGRPQAVYHSLGRDDYLHAEAYDVVARNLLEYRLRYALLAEPEYTTIDELFPEFERSQLGVPVDEDFEYHPGPPEPEFGISYDDDW